MHGRIQLHTVAIQRAALVHTPKEVVCQAGAIAASLTAGISACGIAFRADEPAGESAHVIGAVKTHANSCPPATAMGIEASRSSLVRLAAAAHPRRIDHAFQNVALSGHWTVRIQIS